MRDLRVDLPGRFPPLLGPEEPGPVLQVVLDDAAGPVGEVLFGLAFEAVDALEDVEVGALEDVGGAEPMPEFGVPRMEAFS